MYFKAEPNYDGIEMTHIRKTNRQEFEETTIIIKFSNGDFFRVPLYTRVKEVMIDTYPSLVDFGLVQMGQKPLQIDLYVKFDTKKIKKVEDYLLPLDQPNLDFRLNAPPTDLTAEQAQDKQNGRVFIGSVFLYATKS